MKTIQKRMSLAVVVATTWLCLPQFAQADAGKVVFAASDGASAAVPVDSEKASNANQVPWLREKWKKEHCNLARNACVDERVVLNVGNKSCNATIVSVFPNISPNSSYYRDMADAVKYRCDGENKTSLLTPDAYNHAFVSQIGELKCPVILQLPPPPAPAPLPRAVPEKVATPAEFEPCLGERPSPCQANGAQATTTQKPVVPASSPTAPKPCDQCGVKHTVPVVAPQAKFGTCPGDNTCMPLYVDEQHNIVNQDEANASHKKLMQLLIPVAGAAGCLAIQACRQGVGGALVFTGRILGDVLHGSGEVLGGLGKFAIQAIPVVGEIALGAAALYGIEQLVTLPFRRHWHLDLAIHHRHQDTAPAANNQNIVMPSSAPICDQTTREAGAGTVTGGDTLPPAREVPPPQSTTVTRTYRPCGECSTHQDTSAIMPADQPPPEAPPQITEYFRRPPEITSWGCQYASDCQASSGI